MIRGSGLPVVRQWVGPAVSAAADHAGIFLGIPKRADIAFIT